MKFAFLVLIVVKFYDDFDLSAYLMQSYQLSVPIVSTTGPIPLDVCNDIVTNMRKHEDIIAMCQEIK
jgi:hypothetical protein